MVFSVEIRMEFPIVFEGSLLERCTWTFWGGGNASVCYRSDLLRVFGVVNDLFGCKSSD